MRIDNAIKKLEKAGFEVEECGGRFRAVRGKNVVTFCRNGSGENATAFATTRTDASQFATPLYGWPSLTSIIRSFGPQ